MTDNRDKELYEVMDRLALEAAAEADLPGPLDSNDTACGDDTLARIKQRTFGRLDRDRRASGSRGRRKVWLVAAACLSFVTTAALVGHTTDVGAELRKVLQFLPGFGVVSESPASQQTLVLAKPYVHRFGGSEISVDGIVVQPDLLQVQLSGKQTSSAEQITLLLGDGTSIELKSGSVVSSDTWMGSYYYRGMLPSSLGSRVTLKISDQRIGPLELTPALSAETMQGIGRSDTQQDITVTAVATPLEDGWTKVNLLAQLPGGQQVQSFGAEPINQSIRLQVTDPDGKNAEIDFNHYGFLLRNEFRFRDNSTETRAHTLTLPAVLVQVPHAVWQKVTLPIPRTGALSVQHKVVLEGFPVHFTRIERSDAGGVLIDVDLAYDADKPRTLQTVKIDMRNPENNSYSWIVHEDTRAMKSLHLGAKADAQEITFYVGEPQVLIRGPWRIPLE